MHSRWSKYAEDMGILRGYWQCGNALCACFDDNGHLQINNPQEIAEMLSSKKTRRVLGKDNIIGAFKPDRCVCGSTDFIYHEIQVVSEELNMQGHADMILDFSRLNIEKYKDVRNTFNFDVLPKSPIVIDMKTCNSFAFDKQVSVKGPHSYYAIQLNIYINLLNLKYGVLIYECKDNSKLAAFKIDKDEKMWTVIKEQSSTMKELLKEKRLPPPRPLNKSDYECKDCEFASLCLNSKAWKDEQLEQKRKDFYKHLL
jgi:CRISPR/Cas system-associated exonuclease Cas4 (RecB family)